MLVFFIDLAVPVLALGISIFSDIVATRVTGRRFVGYVVSLTSVVLMTLSLALILGPNTAARTLVLSGVSCAWWFVYLNLAQAVRSSIRFKLIDQVSASSEAISLEALLTKYNDRHLLILRLNRLLESRLVERASDGRYFVRSLALSRLAVFFAMSRVLLLGLSWEDDIPSRRRQM